MRSALLVLLATLAVIPEVAAQEADARVLVFSRTEGFRHASIADGIGAVEALGAERGFAVTATEDPAAFTEVGLAGFDAVVFLNTTGDVLDASHQAAFERYVQAGGGFVGIHAAADTEYDWPWYGGLVGAYFESHPPGTTGAELKVVDRVHPATAGLPHTWARTDEWYNFRDNPRGEVHVLATLDEQTYAGGTMPGDHPIAWCHVYDGGRAFYTAGGHTPATYAEPLFRDHLWGGLVWAAGWEEGDCSATVETSWERTVLDADVVDPMELAVAPDGRVVFVERGGAVKVWDPATSSTHLAATLPVTTSFEDGLLGVTLDPGFAENGWVYLYYSPLGTQPIQLLSRFTMTGTTLDLGSEQVLLAVETDREEGGHSGGSLAFGPDGTLYVATGDDADPFASSGYAPIDERPDRAAWDAQRTSGNPFDLRGKILRIRPLPDGTADIPDGNLFPADGSEGRPEVYAMGVRNPFRISLDPTTGWLYWGDVGPDATTDSPARGPRGYDEFNQARAAGNFGWPYCIADNRPYRDYDFATGLSGSYFDCAAPLNDSPHVPEAPVLLPPSEPAWAYYPYAPSPEFPDIPDGSGRTAMAGPVVRAATPGGNAMPAYFDGSAFFYEWSRNWIIETKLDADGRPLAFQRFLPSLTLNRPIDLELGPDGALYMVEWGAGYGGGNPEAALSRIAYVSGSRAPVAAVQASVTSGPAPLEVTFASDGTYHPDGLSLDYAWDFDGDGTTDAAAPTATTTYTQNGTYLARLTVTDPNGRTATATTAIVVGNSMPVVDVAAPPDGGFFSWGDSLRYAVSATDAEDGSTDDGSIACEAVVVQPGIGHDDHNHPLAEYAGCAGGFRAPDGHGADAENVFLVLEARYTDAGADGVGALTGRRQIVLRPSQVEAEHFEAQSGVQFENADDVLGGGQNAGYIDDGDWLAYDRVHLAGTGFLTFRVASDGAGGRIEARADSPDGPLLATAYVSPTGGWQSYKDVTVPIADPGRTFTLYLVFRNDGGASGLFNLNRFTAHGEGVGVPEGVPEGLVAEYFATPDLSGEPVTRRDPQISFDWDAGAPMAGLPPSDFSVRWTGFVLVPADGRYRFTVRADDGARLWVDGALAIDAWDGEELQEASQAVTLSAGEVPIRLEYRDTAREAEVALLWSGPGITQQTLAERWLRASTTTDTSGPPEGPSPLALAPPFPNPSGGRIEVAFSIPVAGEATVEVFDVLGRRVHRLREGPAVAGPHHVVADLSALPSGVYLVRLALDGETRTRTVTLLR